MTTSLPERLGHPRDARLLIVTSDDLGFTHAVNAAFIGAIDGGVLTSGSVMVPCPWFGEIADFARRRPDVDLGIHLTVTCECEPYRWGPVLGASRVPSLVAADGGFPITEAELLARVDLHELEAELRAQISVARDAGIRPTHLDSHMGVLYMRRDVFELLVRIGADEQLPVRHPRAWAREDADLGPVAEAERVIHNDHVRSAGEDVQPAEWGSFYETVLDDLEPGVTELVLHVGEDTEELRASYGRVEAWGAAWRQRDLDVALDPRVAFRIADLGIVRIGWRDLAGLV